MSQSTSNWANVGDLVFILDRDNDPVPCKITKILGDGTSESTQLFFEPIIYNDKKRIPKNRLKCFLNQVGYKGGFAFKKKENALDYLKILEEGNSPTMSNVISKKLDRNFSKQNNSIEAVKKELETVKHEIERNTVNEVQKVLTAILLITLHEKLKVGPKRASIIVEEINNTLEQIGNGKTTKEEIIKKAEDMMKIKLKGE